MCLGHVRIGIDCSQHVDAGPAKVATVQQHFAERKLHLGVIRAELYRMLEFCFRFRQVAGRDGRGPRIVSGGRRRVRCRLLSS